MEGQEGLSKPKPIPGLPRRAIIAPTDHILQLCLAELKEQEGLHLPRRSLLNFSSLYVSAHAALAGPSVGAPAAVLIAETLAASGVSELCLIGAAGGLCFEPPHPRIGELVIPAGALCDDGTSRLYGAEEVIPDLPIELQEHLEHYLRATGEATRRGMVATTDAPYRETSEKLACFSKLGAIAVEMEYAALLQFSRIRGIALAAVFVISDLRGAESAVGFSRPEFRQALRRAVKGVCSL